MLYEYTDEEQSWFAPTANTTSPTTGKTAATKPNTDAQAATNATAHNSGKGPNL